MNHNEIPEKPILMSAPMVKATLADLKNQTRRIVKPQPNGQNRLPTKRGTVMNIGDPRIIELCPYGQPGHRLWVRENWAAHVMFDHTRPIDIPDHYAIDYLADNKAADPDRGRNRPSIHLPRKFARILLEITSIRVERLQDISAADCLAEGLKPCPDLCGLSCNGCESDDPRQWLKNLWESINGPGSWALNPWVWVVEFKRVTE